MGIFVSLIIIGLGITSLVLRAGYRKNPQKSSRTAIMICSIVDLCLSGIGILLLAFSSLIFIGMDSSISSETENYFPVFTFIFFIVCIIEFVPLAFGIIASIFGLTTVSNKELTQKAMANEQLKYSAPPPTKICPNCGTPYAIMLNACPNCHVPFSATSSQSVNQGSFSTQSATWKCNICGSTNPADAMFCGGCGNKKQ